jgi:hypothetical protein
MKRLLHLFFPCSSPTANLIFVKVKKKKPRRRRKKEEKKERRRKKKNKRDDRSQF